ARAGYGGGGTTLATPGGEQAHLPEDVAAHQGAEGVAHAVGQLANDFDLPLREDVAGIAGVALIEEEIAGVEVEGREGGGALLLLARGERLKEAEPFQFGPADGELEHR